MQDRCNPARGGIRMSDAGYGAPARDISHCLLVARCADDGSTGSPPKLAVQIPGLRRELDRSLGHGTPSISPFASSKVHDLGLA